jgi:hypothetical protein
MLYVFAALEFIGGISILVGAQSAFHEILGTVAIGFSILTLGLAGILSEIQQSRNVLEKRFAELVLPGHTIPAGFTVSSVSGVAAYQVQDDKSVIALMNSGERRRFSTWNEFWNATHS